MTDSDNLSSAVLKALKQHTEAVKQQTLAINQVGTLIAILLDRVSEEDEGQEPHITNYLDGSSVL